MSVITGICHNCTANGRETPAAALPDGTPGVLCLPCILGDVEGPRRRPNLYALKEEAWCSGDDPSLYDTRRPTRDATKEAA